MNILRLKIMHRLSEIQISLGVLNFIWQPYPSPCLQQWARPPQGEVLFRPPWILSRLEISGHQMCFNKLGEKSKGLVLFLSRRLLLRGIFQHLPTKTTGRGVSDKLQRNPLKPILEAVVSVIFFFIYITQKGLLKQFSQQDHWAQDNFLPPSRWRCIWQMLAFLLPKALPYQETH